jgi:uncharacterized damage-inducible protein DinB
METPFVLQTLARYNAGANDQLAALLGPHASRWEEPCGSYFGTVKGLVSHLCTADIRWFGRFAENGWGTPAWRTSVAALPVLAPGKDLFSDWEGFAALRKTLDGLWLDLAASFDGSRFDEAFTYTTIQKEEVTVRWAGVFFHLLNHQTHHRGALSQVLDSWGVDNDYSGLVKSFSLK